MRHATRPGFLAGSADDVDAARLREWNEQFGFAAHPNPEIRCAFLVLALERGLLEIADHAADFYEPLIWEEKVDFVTKDDYPLTDNFYGWGKISYEALGFVFATGSMNDGKRLESVQIRIGAPRENVADDANPEELKKLHRGLGAYLSARDQTQLVIKSVEVEDIGDRFGIPFQVFYGISGNSHRFWGISDAMKKIGYAPEDNSAVKFADKIGEVMKQVTSDK